MAVDAELAQVQEVNVMRGSFRMIVASQFVVFFTLFSVRFVFAGTTVNPNASIWVGLAQTVLVLASFVAGRGSLGAIRSGNPALSERNSLMASIYGFASVGLMFYQWRSLSLPLTNHFAESFYAITGFWILYATISALLYYAMRVRNRNIPFTAQSHWEIEAAATFQIVPAIAWVAILVLLYIV